MRRNRNGGARPARGAPPPLGRRTVPLCPLYPDVRRGLSLVVLGLALAGAATAADEVPVKERLAGGSAERGRAAFLVCRACHAIDQGAAHTIGPNLWGVVGRAVASAEGYDRYTPAMSSYGGVWSPERLDRYLREPMAQVEGTTMVFPGVADARDRADLVAWLNRNSSAPLDLGGGRAGGTQARAEASPPAPPRDLGLLVAGEGAVETHAYCTACHSERIVAQQGLARSGWDELLAQMVEEHEMTPIEEPDRARVLDYLAAHYGPERPNFPRH